MEQYCQKMPSLPHVRVCVPKVQCLYDSCPFDGIDKEGYITRIANNIEDLLYVRLMYT